MNHRIEGAYDEVSWFGVVKFDGEVLSPHHSQALRNHSPDGFAWGYAGSGPAQLALAILLRAGVFEHLALQYYQRFKSEHLVNLKRETFALEIDVESWIAGQIELDRITKERAEAE